MSILHDSRDQFRAATCPPPLSLSLLTVFRACRDDTEFGRDKMKRDRMTMTDGVRRVIARERERASADDKHDVNGYRMLTLTRVFLLPRSCAYSVGLIVRFIYRGR